MSGARQHPGAGAEQRRPRSVAILPLLAALLAILPLAAAAGPELTVQGYRTALVKARALAVAPPREIAAPALAERIAAVLPLQADVRMPSGSIVTVDNRPLMRLLASPPAASSQLPAPSRRSREPRSRELGAETRASWERWRFVEAVDQLLAAVPVPVLSPSSGTAGADRVLRAVLARPEYQYKEQKPSLVERFFDWLGSVLTRFFLWLGHLLERLLPPSERRPGRADQLARLMVIGVVLLLAVLIARIILVALPNLRARRSREGERPAGELLVPSEPDALLAEAEREAAAGHYREALRLAYLAAVARLDRAGILPEDRSRTHWELLRDLRGATRNEERGMRNEEGTTCPHPPPLIPHSSSLIPIFAPLTQRLDERLFGGRTATIEDYQAGRAAHDQIERLLCAPA